MSLISLVYVSFAAHDMTDNELRELLEECRVANEPIHVTGMLLYRDGFFIQALEGEREAVEKLYESITRDPRHRNVTLIFKGDIHRRSFPNWTMGYHRIEQFDDSTLPGFTEFLDDRQDMSFFSAHPSRATHLLEVFKAQANY